VFDFGNEKHPNMMSVFVRIRVIGVLRHAKDDSDSFETLPHDVEASFIA
jgi:hypothetical protein